MAIGHTKVICSTQGNEAMQKLSNKALATKLHAAEHKLDAARTAIYQSEPNNNVLLSVIINKLGDASPLVINHRAAVAHQEAVRAEGRSRVGNLYSSHMIDVLDHGGRRRKAAQS